MMEEEESPVETREEGEEEEGDNGRSCFHQNGKKMDIEEEGGELINGVSEIKKVEMVNTNVSPVVEERQKERMSERI